MSTYFRCSACSQTHRSRLFARDAEWLDAIMRAFQEIYEVCPRTGTWVRLGYGDVEWVADRPAEPVYAR